MKLGLTFYSVLKMPIEDIIVCAKRAEEAGFSHISFAESFYRDVSALASSVACNTSRIKLGTSVYPTSTRTPFQVAMASATLDEISNGRLGFVGLGVGYKARIERYFGTRVDKSTARMLEYIQVVRGLLSGEPFSYAGKNFNFNDFPPLVPKKLDIPILLGSSAPNMLRLSGREADGVVLNSIGTKEYFEYALSMIGQGAREAGKTIGDLEIGASIVVSVADRHEDAVAAARPDVLFYLLYPELDPVISKTRFVERIEAIRQANSKGNSRLALSLVSDEMVEDLAVVGTPSECRTKMKEMTKHRITLSIVRVSVQPFSEKQRKEVFLRTINALANL
ncbi:MAG: LLM class flavin-dependent oxidoreductase [Nitrososphaerales archaeon]